MSFEEAPMKTLILIRHAAAEAAELEAGDFHRPLSPAGEKEAERMACLIRKEIPKPDMIVSSPADRTLETAHIFARRWGFDKRKILLVESIYQGHPLTRLQTLVHDFDDRFRRIAIVGHNPSLSDLARLFLCRRSTDIPKAGILSIDFATEEWKNCGPQTASFKSFDVSHEAVQAMKWAKPIRRELTSRLLKNAHDVLAAINPGNAEATREELKPAMKKIAARFIKSADRIRLTDRNWLDLLETTSPDEPAAPLAPGRIGSNRSRRKAAKPGPVRPPAKTSPAAFPTEGPRSPGKKKSVHGQNRQ